MAEDPQLASIPDNKRKFDDPPPPRRPTGFSAPIASLTPDKPAAAAAAPAPPSYSSVPPPPDEFQLVKQRVQEAAARLMSDAKRPRVENGVAAADDANDKKGFAATYSDNAQKPLGQQISPFPSYGAYMGSSRKIEIPNGRVGVIIGRGGETIKYLQQQSGARIQVTKDSEADINSQIRLVELTGTSEQMVRAEQLIKDVLAEAEAGGSSMLAGRRSGGAQFGGEQFSMTVPNDKVGLIIGKSGDTIRSMQTKSGARIQIIPLHPHPGEVLLERTVQIDGTAEQIETAKQLVTEVISANRIRNQQITGGYHQQAYHPPQPSSWGQAGQPPIQQPGYGYGQPGAYPGATVQYNMSQPSYGGYPTPAGFQSGWDQQPNPPAQQTVQGTGYDYYNQQQPQNQQPLSGTAPADSTGYNYSQPPTYGSNASYGDANYSQVASGQQQSYVQDNLGGYNASAQPGYSQQTNPQAGYDQGYGSVPPYGAVSNPAQDGSATSAQPGYSQQTNPQAGYDQGYGYVPPYGDVSNPAQDGCTTTYGVQGGLTQVSSSQQVHGQPSSAPQGYASQPPASYPSQGTAQPVYGMPPTTQTGYGGQPSSQGGYAQSVPSTQQSYGQPPVGQQPPSQTLYAHAQQPPSSQAGYVQPAPVQSAYQMPPAQGGYVQDASHNQAAPGLATAGPPPGYGQQQPYGSTPQMSQPVYGQQQPQPYSQQPAYSNDGPARGSYDAAAATQTGPSAAKRASPQG